jgi:hypothetical protein
MTIRRGCSCIQSGGNGQIILTFSDGIVPWRCPETGKCRLLRYRAEQAERKRAVGDIAKAALEPKP